jgi:hypothetical protein
MVSVGCTVPHAARKRQRAVAKRDFAREFMEPPFGKFA